MLDIARELLEQARGARRRDSAADRRRGREGVRGHARRPTCSSVDEVRADEMILDIGPDTAERFARSAAERRHDRLERPGRRVRVRPVRRRHASARAGDRRAARRSRSPAAATRSRRSRSTASTSASVHLDRRRRVPRVPRGQEAARRRRARTARGRPDAERCSAAPRSSPRSARPPTRRGARGHDPARRRRRARSTSRTASAPIRSSASKRSGPRRERVGKHVAVLGDLQGPEDPHRALRGRHGRAERGRALRARPGDRGARRARHAVVGVAYDELAARRARRATTLLLDDGQIELEVLEVSGARIEARVTVGGELSDHKGSTAGRRPLGPALTDKDREDMRTAAELGVDYLAVSFVRAGRGHGGGAHLLRAAGGNAAPRREDRAQRGHSASSTRSCRASDAIMVARGDLGVEVGYARADRACRRTSSADARARTTGSTITATQMMESMIHSPVPTRAEVSDVANAVMDGTDAVMLSGETRGRQVSGDARRGDGGGDRGRREVPVSHSPAVRDRFEGMIETHRSKRSRAP